jgi:hypothetical protein
MPITVPDEAEEGEGGHVADHNMIAAGLTSLSADLDDVTSRMPTGKVTVSDTAPTAPQEGDLWFDTSGAG